MYILYSDKIVLKDRVISGYVVVDEAVITEVVENQVPNEDYIDYTGKYIMPGMIDFQCEALIRAFEHGRSVTLPDETLFIKVERDLALSGITTVFHDLAIDRFTKKSDIDQLAETMLYVKSYRDRDFLIDHKTNLKIRLGQVRSSETLMNLVIADAVDLITYMGDITDEEEYYKDEYQLQYLMTTLNIEEDEARAVIDKIKQNKIESSAEELGHRLKYCENHNIAVASTKYKVVSKVEEDYKMEVDIISNPRTVGAWDYIEDKQKFAVMDLDYLEDEEAKERFIAYCKKSKKCIITARSNPELLLEYVFEMADTIGMVEAVGLVTTNPSIALKMETTGDIAPGKEADIIVVDANGTVPITILSISDGEIIYGINYNEGRKSK